MTLPWIEKSGEHYPPIATAKRCCEAMACHHSNSMVKARLVASAMNRVARYVNRPSRLVAKAHSGSLTLHHAKPSGLIARLTFPKVREARLIEVEQAIEAALEKPVEPPVLLALRLEHEPQPMESAISDRASS
jgi:hypothetical protein